MDGREMLLAAARRRVAEAQARVEEQAALVADAARCTLHAARCDHDTAQAKAVLDVFEGTLLFFQEDLARLEAEAGGERQQ